MSASLLILLIPLLPLIGFLINGLGFKKIPKSVAGVLGTAAAIGSFVFSLLAFNSFLGSGSEPAVYQLFDWITVGTLNISFAFNAPNYYRSRVVNPYILHGLYAS